MATKTSEQKRHVANCAGHWTSHRRRVRAGAAPELYNAITVKMDSGQLVAEVEQHIGRNQIARSR